MDREEEEEQEQLTEREVERAVGPVRWVGACRAEERSQGQWQMEMAVLVRCLCAPLVSLRVGLVRRLERERLLCPVPRRGRLLLLITPASRLQMSFVGDDGRAQQLCALESSSIASQLVTVQEIAADPSGRSFLVSVNAHAHAPSGGRSFYYWLSHRSLPQGLRLLHKMRDLLTRRPTLSDLTGISASRLHALLQPLPLALPSSSSSPSPSPSPSHPHDHVDESPLAIPSLPFNSPSPPPSPPLLGLSAALPPDFSPFNPLTFQFPLPPATHIQPHAKPQYCWCPMGPSHVSSPPPTLPLSLPVCTQVLLDPLVHLPLPVSSLVVPPLPGSSCSQFPAFKGLMSDPIVHMPVISISSAGQAYLVSAGLSISSGVPPLVINPLVATTDSLVENNARETLLRLLESGPMPTPIHAVAFGLDVSSAAVTSVEIGPCFDNLSNEVSDQADNQVEGDE